MGLWWRIVLVVSAALPMWACSTRAPAAKSSSRSADEHASRAKAVPLDRPAAADRMQVYLDLQNIVHLADVDSDGLYIDFGTPAREGAATVS